jgi:hypothetical protein
MKIPEKFDPIRPFEPEELPEAYEKLLSNEQFRQVLHYLYPQVPIEMMAQKMRSCKTNLDFQLTFCYGFVKDLLKKASLGCDFDCSGIDRKRNYTFMSNHRDIVLDSAILDVMLLNAKFTQEFQLKRDVEGWKKGPQDDLISMQTGIMGFKGHIHYHCAPCLDDFLKGLDTNLPKNEFYRLVAEHIDHEIHRNYRLYPSNYVALDLLKGNTEQQSHYTAEEKASFEKYVAAQLAKINLPNKDEAYLKERLLTMYANPAINYMAAL